MSIETIKDMAPIALTIAAGLLFYQKLRAEEMTKLRFQLIIDAFESFTNLKEAVATWASPVQFIDKPDEVFMRVLQRESPRAFSGVIRAQLLLPKRTADRMLNILREIENLRGQHGYFLQLQKHNKEYLREGQQLHPSDTLVGAWKNARETIPARIIDIHSEIQNDFLLLTNGIPSTLLKTIIGNPVLRMVSACLPKESRRKRKNATSPN
ncbi:hypothetical protein [Leptospira santarosai]|uniref:hypothetical protein n=1 Tax=Leptospira santarosai TaxID=28183 RepID=UPI0002979B6E|nr:hypothetical protein [Leptospira santarosai]EKS06767.1 hypothetical protein LEP1GSC071_0271 [Leptospira santarosai str. JET]